MELVFSKKALNDLRKLDQSIRRRVVEKLEFYSQHAHPTKFAEPLRDPYAGQYRFRIGDWRVFVRATGDKIFVLKVGHRREVYR
ncbi:type II toxin-antitoxin system RelE/ParE family toxin [Candidatus Berkelbacteria bacterium]|nr:type II toxin-antitoxin system RelE/ParE family toxin [Candidatus Berkelbacteria bacterium]